MVPAPTRASRSRKPGMSSLTSTPAGVDREEILLFMSSQISGIASALTGLPQWVQHGAPPLFAVPLKVFLIVLLAVAARIAARKMIDRAVRQMIDKPLRSPLRRPAREPETHGTARERRRQRSQAIGDVLRSAATIAIFSIATVMILGELTIDVAPIIASAGIAGLAFGFGAQSLVSDFLAGLFMLMEDQYGVGDWVDISGTSGTVEVVGLRVTKLRDLDGAVWYVRNGQVLKLGNFSQDWARAVLDVPFAFEKDVEAGSKALEEAAWSLWDDPDWRDKVIDSPCVSGITTLSRDEVTMRVWVTTPPSYRWEVGNELRRRVRSAIAHLDVEVP
ncbi:MAG: mechanosensitive ion channel family protein [Nocardioidaceae bacterium]